MPADRIADSIGSTDSTAKPSRLPIPSATVLLPAPGKPAIAINMTTRYGSDERCVPSHERQAVGIERQESVVGIRRDDSSVTLRDSHLTCGQRRKHRLVTGENTDLADRGARNHLLREA